MKGIPILGPVNMLQLLLEKSEVDKTVDMLQTSVLSLHKNDNQILWHDFS